MAASMVYFPPTGPVDHDGKPPLVDNPDLPFDVIKFARLGWVSLPMKNLNPSLYEAYQNIFRDAASFFDSALDDQMKFHIPAHMQTSEEGFSIVEGEKCMITLRRSGHCPDLLKEDSQRAWRETGEFLDGIAQGIAKTLGLQDDVYQGFTKPCTEKMPENEKLATLFRLFRYDRPPAVTSTGQKGSEGTKIVSQTHRDLGFLTIVVGHSPGLEGWDDSLNGGKGDWVSIEENKEDGELTFTLLVGQTLVRLTNARYTAGRHRVLVHPPNPERPSPYRFSAVYALRAHMDTVVTSEQFTTPITGDFTFPFGPDHGHETVTMGDIYKSIADAHYNVNIDPKLREVQRQRILAGATSGRYEKEKDGEKTGEFEKRGMRASIARRLKRFSLVKLLKGN